MDIIWGVMGFIAISLFTIAVIKEDNKTTEQYKKEQIHKSNPKITTQNTNINHSFNQPVKATGSSFTVSTQKKPKTQAENYANSNIKTRDVAGNWLTVDEYSQLSTAEKYQRALDRYLKRNKTNKEIGTDYERYIGYLYEMQGYSVKYFGIENGLEDLGRDLICTNKKEILIIQCKCWSNIQGKVIHEKHINQLHGTATMYKMKHNPKNKEVKAVLVSTVPCTDTAKEFAEYLGVTFKQIPLEKYPMIKCNINKATKEKIYHLPFDQQYDKCSIKQESGEFYAMTVKEAEEKGFRRAMKWHGK